MPLLYPVNFIRILLNVISDLECQSAENIKELRQKLHDLEVSNAKLRNDLTVERNNYSHLEKEYVLCKEKLGATELGNKLKETNFDRESEYFQEIASKDHVAEIPCSACCRKATEQLERKLKKTQLKLAESKAERNTLVTSEKKLIETLHLKKFRLEQTEEALSRLKTKSRTLLKQYRGKKHTLSAVSSKLESVRNSLLDLKELCKKKDENYKDILSHFGGQIEISARLLANYLNVPMNTSKFNLILKVLILFRHLFQMCRFILNFYLKSS